MRCARRVVPLRVRIACVRSSVCVFQCFVRVKLGMLNAFYSASALHRQLQATNARRENLC